MTKEHNTERGIMPPDIEREFWMIQRLDRHEEDLKETLRLTRKYRKKLKKGRLLWCKERHEFMEKRDVIF